MRLQLKQQAGQPRRLMDKRLFRLLLKVLPKELFRLLAVTPHTPPSRVPPISQV